jgi:early secretory antigenic target protein ESAT-6
MADQIEIDFKRLAGTQQELAATVNKMNTTLTDLQEYIKPLTATWTGEASTQYQALQAKWDTSAADLNAVLGRITTALADAIAQMKAAEAKVAATF